MFSLQDAPKSFSHFANELKKYCKDSHADFNHPSPLWKNEKFSVQLSFKKNENITTTKATHLGMNPKSLFWPDRSVISYCPLVSLSLLNHGHVKLFMSISLREKEVIYWLQNLSTFIFLMINSLSQELKCFFPNYL